MIAGTRESKARTDYLLAKIADKIIRLFELEHVTLYGTNEFKGLFAGAVLKYAGTTTIKYHQKVHIA